MPREEARPPVAGLAAEPAAPVREARIAPAELGWMLAPLPTLRGETTGFIRDLPAEAPQQLAAASPAPSPAPEPLRLAEAAPAALVPPPAAPSEAVQPATTPLVAVPLPVPRPPELRPAEARPAADRAGNPPAAAPEPGDGLDPERVQGRPAGRAVAVRRIFGGGGASAAVPDPRLCRTRRSRSEPAPRLSASPGIAIYDISARTVTLPSGEALEAHSASGRTWTIPATST